MILSLLLLMGMQQVPPMSDGCKDKGDLCVATSEPRLVGDIVIADPKYCEATIRFGHSSKKLSEIFPEECTRIDIPDDQDDLFQRAAPNGVLENVGDEPGGTQTGQLWLPTAGPHLCGDTCKIAAPEPLDVPAIQIFIADKNSVCEYARRGEIPMRKADLLKTCYAPSCADKTRILEHDEQVPPLYWCRKVQTGGKP